MQTVVHISVKFWKQTKIYIILILYFSGSINISEIEVFKDKRQLKAQIKHLARASGSYVDDFTARIRLIRDVILLVLVW